MLAAGRLRDRITVKRLTDTPTGRGGFTRAWATVAGMSRMAAEVISISGREAVIANTLHGDATYRITIRWRPLDQQPRTGDQIVWHAAGGDVELNVKAPPSDRYGRREELQIIADTSAPQNA
jgi:head-tail adaptor